MRELFRCRWCGEPVGPIPDEPVQRDPRIDIYAPRDVALPYEIEPLTKIAQSTDEDRLDVIRVRSSQPTLRLGAQIAVHLRWRLVGRQRASLRLWLGSFYDRYMTHSGRTHVADIVRGEGEAELRTTLAFPSGPHVVMLHGDRTRLWDVSIGSEDWPLEIHRLEEQFRRRG